MITSLRVASFSMSITIASPPMKTSSQEILSCSHNHSELAAILLGRVGAVRAGRDGSHQRQQLRWGRWESESNHYPNRG